MRISKSDISENNIQISIIDISIILIVKIVNFFAFVTNTFSVG